MAITTTDSFKGNHGQYCRKCGVRKSLLRITNEGLVCTECDPRAETNMIRPVAAPDKEETPAGNG